MSDLLSVGETAKRIGARAPDITSAFYNGRLRDDLCPLVGGRRLIPESYVPMIEMVLRRAGKISPLSRANSRPEQGENRGN